jgi:hypothetical protein
LRCLCGCVQADRETCIAGEEVGDTLVVISSRPRRGREVIESHFVAFNAVPPNKADAADTKKRHTFCLRKSCATFRRR